MNFIPPSLLPILLAPLLILAGFVTPPASRAADNDFAQQARTLLQLTEEMDDRTSSSARLAAKDRNALETQRDQLRKEADELEAALALSRQHLSEQSLLRAKLAERYLQEMADMKTVEGIFRSSLQRTAATFEAGPVAAMHPEQLNVLKKLTSGEFMPDISDIEEYSDLLFADMNATATVEERQMKVVGVDGQVVVHNLVRAGGFFLGYTVNGNSFFALPQGELPPLSIAESTIAARSLTSWLTGTSEVLPLDITGGAAFTAMQERRSLAEWFEAGGVLLYPIAIAGALGILITILKTVHLLFNGRLSASQRATLFAQLGEEDAMQSPPQSPRLCPARRVINGCLEYRDRGLDALDNRLEETILREQSRLERFLSTIGVLASISPLLGLLGTVTGMIDTFQAITLYGTGDPRMMSTGISEALITTQAGLAVALPLLLAHHFLKRRVAALVADMEESGSGVIALLSSR